MLAGPLKIERLTGRLLDDVGALTLNGAASGVLPLIAEIAEMVCDK